MPNQNPARTRRFQCRHIFTDGHRCGSPCLRGEDFCYYHHSNRRIAQSRVQDLGDRSSMFELPFPEDRAAIQGAIAEVLQRIAGDSIDTKRAGLLLYGLQIAVSNLPKAKPGEAEQPFIPVERYTSDIVLGDLAPPAFIDGAEEEIPSPAEDQAGAEPLPETSTETEGFETAKEKVLRADGRLRPTLPQKSVAQVKEGYYQAFARLNKQLSDSLEEEARKKQAAEFTCLPISKSTEAIANETPVISSIQAVECTIPTHVIFLQPPSS